MKKSRLLLMSVLALLLTYSCEKSEGFNGSSGVGGSMSRFAIGDGHLYVLTEQTLRVFQLDENDKPILISNVNIQDVIETIFYLNNTLFIGSQNGMYIYDVSSPSRPVQLSVYSHITSCDPVVVSDSIAYVTLRSGSECGGGQNLLEVIDVSNLRAPSILSSYNLEHPYGLTVAGDYLLVCQGDAGLSVYQRGETDLTPFQSFDGIDSYDVISIENVAIVTGADGIYQLDISDFENISELSHIPAVVQ